MTCSTVLTSLRPFGWFWLCWSQTLWWWQLPVVVPSNLGSKNLGRYTAERYLTWGTNKKWGYSDTPNNKWRYTQKLEVKWPKSQVLRALMLLEIHTHHLGHFAHFKLPFSGVYSMFIPKSGSVSIHPPFRLPWAPWPWSPCSSAAQKLGMRAFRWCRPGSTSSGEWSTTIT